MVNRGIAQRTLLICMHRWERPRMRCRRLPMSSSDPKRPRGDLRTTNRQDSTDALAMAVSSISRMKKIFFSPPRTCPIDLFGPIANRTVLKQLHAAFHTNPTLNANMLISKLGARRCLHMSPGVSWDVYCDVGRPRVERGVIIESNICWAYTGAKGTVAQFHTAFYPSRDNN